MTPGRRRLPHIDANCQSLFVTFRLHDSLPANRPFPPSNVTSGEAFVWLDRLLDHARCGPVFLKQPAIAELVLTSIQCGVEIEHYELHAWAIMPNHVHPLIIPKVSASKLLGALKAATAKQANVLLQRTGQPFWQDESYDHVVRNDEEFRRIWRYIENNPVVAGLAFRPEEYAWSSAGRPGRPPQAEGLPHEEPTPHSSSIPSPDPSTAPPSQTRTFLPLPAFSLLTRR
ncbi:MAG: transposase [Bryobacteraceae bacterium]